MAPGEICQTAIQFVQARGQTPQHVGQLLPLGGQLGKAFVDDRGASAGGVPQGS